MNEDTFRAEWTRLSEMYSKNLDNPRQRSIIQKKIEALWKRFERSH